MKVLNGKRRTKAYLVGLFLALGMVFNPIKTEAVLEVSEDYYVTDYEGVISDTVKDYIMRVNERFSLEEESPEIALVVIPSLEGETIESYARQQLRSMNLGTARYKNGVLILFAPNERKIRIEVAEGLQGAISHHKAESILDKSMDSLRKDDFSTAIYEIFGRLAVRVQNEYGYSIIQVQESFYSEEELNFMSVIIALGSLFTLFIVFDFSTHVSICRKENIDFGLTITSYFDKGSGLGIHSEEFKNKLKSSSGVDGYSDYFDNDSCSCDFDSSGASRDF